MKLSIITVNLNNAPGLHKTIESVITQTFTDYEYIIIDGGSTDGSVDIIKQYSDKITYWISEPDKGIYNAMNKGIVRANGEYCLFLNSGDWLFNTNVLQDIFSYNLIKMDVIYGNLQTENGIIIHPNHLSLAFFFKSGFYHQAVFIRKSLFKNYGLYNEDLKIVSDWLFFLDTIIDKQSSYLHLDTIICYYDLTGISSSQEYKDLLIQERKIILKSQYPMMYEDYEELMILRQEVNQYKNSRLIKIAKKIQSINMYKKIKRLF